MWRRTFLTGSGLSVLGGTSLSIGSEPEGSTGKFSADGRTVQEPARAVPIAGEADVIICGAGPAGVAAAIAAARSGAQTILLDALGCLGGIWTASLLGYILDMKEKTGLLTEIACELEKLPEVTHRDGGGSAMSFDPEVMKLVLEQMCLTAGVRIRYYTRCVAAVKEGRRVRAVITESKSGREAFLGKIFIDCTGDGDFAVQAGCGYDFGNPETGGHQPMSYNVLVTGISPETARPFIVNIGSHSAAKKALREEMKRAGVIPSYSDPSLFLVRKDLYVLMSNHIYNKKGFNADDMTSATLLSRRELFAQTTALRKLGGIWKDLRIVATPNQPGVREGRRIHGQYTVTADDLREGRTQPDAVCKVRFPIDVHSTDPKATKGIEMKTNWRAKPYDIPLRSLIARDVDGLLMAGRCISGDFIAHSSYRVTGNAVPMGEAAGKYAAELVKSMRK